MSLCSFEYASDGDGYEASCTVCGRRLKTKSRDVYAACKASPDYLDTRARMAGEIPGPGTFLKKLLRRWLKIEPSGNCPCEKHAMVMDMWGPGECERRMEEIVGWLREEAARRGLPFVDTAGRMLVRIAISRARANAREAQNTRSQGG